MVVQTYLQLYGVALVFAWFNSARLGAFDRFHQTFVSAAKPAKSLKVAASAVELKSVPNNQFAVDQQTATPAVG